jgi:hypothetical protein
MNSAAVLEHYYSELRESLAVGKPIRRFGSG